MFFVCIDVKCVSAKPSFVPWHPRSIGLYFTLFLPLHHHETKRTANVESFFGIYVRSSCGWKLLSVIY